MHTDMKTMKPFLSICITSYNRVNELNRCLQSIDSIYPEQIEIIISEDCSPKRDKIIQVVDDYKRQTKYAVTLNLNVVNLGYDGNLEKLISLSSGKYIVFMSDDDMFIENAIDQVVAFLKTHDCGLLYTPFKREGTLYRKYKNTHLIHSSVCNAAHRIYDAILFSGLVFERENIKCISALRFRNLNYFQVYLFLYVLTQSNGYYFNRPLVNCVGDGENAYGIAASNEKNQYLADRTSIYSNLEFHKGLIKVIKTFELDEGVSVMPIFACEYSLRTYTGLSLACRAGKEEFKEYWKRLMALDIQLTVIVYIYYYILKLFGHYFADMIMNIPRKIVTIYRRNK